MLQALGADLQACIPAVSDAPSGLCRLMSSSTMQVGPVTNQFHHARSKHCTSGLSLMTIVFHDSFQWHYSEECACTGLALGKAPVHENDLGDIHTMITTNIESLAVLTKFVAAGMVKRDWVSQSF